MKKIELPCEVVQDLMPNYIDELTSEVTTNAVKEHMETCRECRAVYSRMTGEVPMEKIEGSKDAAEIDFLKKTNKRQKINMGRTILVTVLVLAAIWAAQHFLIGKTCQNEMLDYNLTVDGNEITFYGEAVEWGKGISGITFKEENGEVAITVKETGKSFFHKDNKTEIFYASNGIDTVTLNGTVIWQNGLKISDAVSKLYATKHPYIGDISADQHTANAMDMGEVFGPYLNSLQTSEEPYRWTMESEENFTEEESTKLENLFPRYAAVLMALIDNMGESEFTYKCDGAPKSILVTKEDADKLFGGDVKTAVTCVSDLQAMINKLDIDNSAFFHYANSQNGIHKYGVNVENQAEGDISGIAVTLYVEDEPKTTQGASRADGDTLDKGDQFGFEFAEREIIDIGVSRDSNMKVGVKITMSDNSVIELDQFEIDVEKEIFGETKDVRTLVIEGNKEAGYTAR